MPERIAYRVARQIVNHAEAAAPNEACGLLAGNGATIVKALPLRNAAAAPAKSFGLDPEEQLAALKAIDADGLAWIGVYHSHPRSAPIPSRADIAEAADSNLLHLIVSLERAKPQLKLWRIDSQSATPLDLILHSEMFGGETEQLSKQQKIAIVAAGIASLLLLVALSVALLPPPPELAP